MWNLEVQIQGQEVWNLEVLEAIERAQEVSSI